jgi:hypothetical protein
MPSMAEFAAVLVLALSVAFIGWTVVRITSHAEK